MGRIESDRCQQRHHIAMKDLAGPFFLSRIPLCCLVKHHTFSFECGKHLLIEQSILPSHQNMDSLLNALKRLFGRQTIRPHQMRMLCNLRLETRHPDFKKLIQVGAHNTDVTQPFQRRRIGPLSHRQDAFVELQQ